MSRKAISLLLAVPMVLILITLSAVSTAGYFGQACQAFELASHFRFLYAIAFVPCLLALCCLRYWKTLCLGLVFFILNAIPIAALYIPEPRDRAPDDAACLSILQLNV